MRFGLRLSAVSFQQCFDFLIEVLRTTAINRQTEVRSLKNSVSITRQRTTILNNNQYFPHPTMRCLNSGYVESGYQVANGSEPPCGGNNYDEVSEFNPIKHHNHFCPWVNGNTAAAGCSSSSGSGSTAGALALSGWQLTLDALDAFQLLGHVPVQTVESESAASNYKDDHHTPGRKLSARHSFNKSYGKN
ncbi:hypothetical protein OROMI_002693 [Orobanche minor]